ncbi:MAG: hypothetical protein Q9226_002867 [Calogaya cf. arnoldii]
MASYDNLTQIPNSNEGMTAKTHCLSALIIFCFRRVAKIPSGPTTLALLIDQQLSDGEKQVWVGLQKLFKHMCAEHQRVHAKPLLSRDDTQDDDKIWGMWAPLRLMLRAGQPLPKLGYAAWDDGRFFKPDYRETIDGVLMKNSNFGLRTGIHEVRKATGVDGLPSTAPED